MDVKLKLKTDVKEMELEPKLTSFGKNSEMMLNLKSSKSGHIFDGDDTAARDDGTCWTFILAPYQLFCSS
jgi:hypothetical protein